MDAAWHKKSLSPRLRGEVAEGRRGEQKTSKTAAWHKKSLPPRLRGEVAEGRRGEQKTSKTAAWRGQYLRRLADPVMTPLDGANNHAAWEWR